MGFLSAQSTVADSHDGGQAVPQSGGRSAAVYARVSTEDQGEHGTSLITQEAACRALCEERGYAVPPQHLVRDSFSGAGLHRPGLNHLRDLVTHGDVQAVCYYAPDRLSRDAVDLMVLIREFQRAGIEVLSVHQPPVDDPLGRAMTFLAGTFAEVERREIAERTMRGKKEAARQGRVPTGFGKFPGPYGLRFDKTVGRFLFLSEMHKAVVRRIFDAILAGRNISSVTDELNDSGITSWGGGLWWRSSVQKILKNAPLYAGQYVWNGIPVPGVGPEPVITPEDVEIVHQRLQRNRERSKGFGKRTLLSGRVFGECGRAYTLSRDKGCRCGGRSSSLPKPVRCEDVSIGLVTLEGIVTGVLDELINSPDALHHALATLVGSGSV